MKIYKPEIYPANSGGATDEIVGELRNRPGIRFLDTIESQLQQLVKCRNPKVKFGDDYEKYQQFIEEYLNGRSMDDIGNYVHYPWKNVVVRLLSEDEFVEVRTNRNRYKITDAEQELLRSKKVGIIGLSVGQAVAVTMAMERVAGEIRLADFDEIELTNLNRIRTDLTNLGVNKAVQVAREISEFDPYLKIKVYEDGITKDNIDSFFTEGGKLDALVEECDGLDIKIIARRKARDLGIPVVMETNDRAMLDIERFDLEPDRPILHGLVEGLDPEKLRTLKTNEDKVPYMLDMIGIDKTSPDLRASMLEIEQSINTWPQLASSVALGGGIVVNTVRQILLQNEVISGRYYFDIEEQILRKSSAQDPFKYTNIKSITKIEMDEIARSFHVEAGIDLTQEQFYELTKMAHTAPSGGNMQPWRWLYKGGVIYAFVDFKDATSFLDYNYLGTMLGFGAASENITITAKSLGLEAKCDFVFETRSPLVATYTFTKYDGVKDDLFEFISSRGTNRRLGNLIPIEPTAFDKIETEVLKVPGAKLQWITKDKDELGDILAAIERIRFLTDQGHTDFTHEFRWTTKEAIDKKDGIDLRTVDLTETEKAGIYVAQDYRVMRKLRNWGLGGGFETMMRKAVENTERIGFISMPSGTQKDYFEGGRACQRAWLEATKLDLGFHPISPSTFIFSRFINEPSDAQLEPFKPELTELRKKYESILNTDITKGEIFLFRLFKGNPIGTRALRRNFKDQAYYEE